MADPPADPRPAARPDPERAALETTVRLEGARILATLVRTLGDLQLAEDAVQEAAARALRDWPRHGVPPEPRAWLTLTARRAALDTLRREGLRAGKEQDGSAMAVTNASDPPSDSVVRDDRLRLIFTCCHPALALDAQVPLALRTLCGLSPAQIAGVLLTSEAAVSKRLTRARTKIARARIPYRVPPDAELPARLAAVCAVVHALYTAAHTARSGDALRDVDGCAEAVRLARLVHELVPADPMPAAVLALLLLTEARAPARVDADGDVVLLADQDRSRWDRAAIAEGRRLLEDSLRRTGAVADPYQLQAAIAAEHAAAPTAARTDWPEIVRLYDLLLSVRPSAPALLARAVAVAHVDGAVAGLAALDALDDADPRVEAVRSELLALAGRRPDAVLAARRALAGDTNAAERRYRVRRIAEWSQEPAPGPHP